MTEKLNTHDRESTAILPLTEYEWGYVWPEVERQRITVEEFARVALNSLGDYFGDQLDAMTDKPETSLYLPRFTPLDHAAPCRVSLVPLSPDQTTLQEALALITSTPPFEVMRAANLRAVDKLADPINPKIYDYLQHEKSTINERRAHDHNVSLRLPEHLFADLIGIALVDDTTIGAQLRAASRSYLDERLSDPSLKDKIDAVQPKLDCVGPPEQE